MFEYLRPYAILTTNTDPQRGGAQEAPYKEVQDSSMLLSSTFMKDVHEKNVNELS